MTVVGLANIAARLGVSKLTAKRLAKSGTVQMRLVGRRRLACPQAIASYRQDRFALDHWEGEGGAIRLNRPADRALERTDP